MADNLTTQSATPATIPASTVISTDDAGAEGHVQRVKLSQSADGVATPITADANGLLVNLGSNVVPLPTGASTSAKQDTQTTALQAIQTAVETLDNTVAGSELQVDVVSSALPTGASTAAKQPALGTAGTPSADVITVQGITSMTALKVDGSAVTQPVSGTVAVSGAVPVTDNSGSLTVDNAALSVTGGGVEASALRVTIATDSTGVVSVDDNGSTLSIDDGAGSITVDNGGTFATQSTLQTGDNTVGRVKLTDGTTVATIRELGTSDALNVSIVDGSGNQVTTFGGGTITQYADGTNPPYGTGILMMHVSGGEITSVSEASPLSVVVGSNVGVTGSISLTDDNGATRATIANLTNSNPLAVMVTDASGNQVVPFAGGTVTVGNPNAQYTEADTDASITGTAVMWEDTSDTLRAVSAAKPLPVNVVAGGAGDGSILDGVDTGIKATVLDYTNSNPLAVRLTDTSGDYVGAGAGTQYTEDAAAAANPTGTAVIAVRADSLAAVTDTDGDNITARATNKGELYVKHVDAVPVTDNSGSLTVDGTVAVSSVGGAVAVTQSGTWDEVGINDSGNSLTVDAPVGTPVYVRLSDGSAAISTLPVSAFKPGTIDSFGHVIIGDVNNDVDVQFYRAASPPAITDIVTVTTASGGSAAVSNGLATFLTTTTASSRSKGVSLVPVVYTAGAEVYMIFTAGFTGTGSGTSYHRIGLYNDYTDGFYIGYEAGTFGVTLLKGTSPTQTAKASWNVDTLVGGATSKFTRAGTPEAIDLTKLNVWRIRFGWVGSAPIYFEVLSPDGEWVTFHKILQPNLAATPSINTADLYATCDVNAGNSGAALSIISNCWGAGTTQKLRKLTDTLTSNTLAGLTRSVITGVTTGGGGSYVNVKVNPSGALTAEVTNGGTFAVQSTNQANSGVDIGDVTINNAAGASAVNIQDGGNSITVDGTVAVSGTVTVGSHAVTNAGTFAVQESGSALTALQLIDDAVATTASAIPAKGLAVSGTDGTNARVIKTDTSGELQVDVLTMPTTVITNTVLSVVGGGTEATAQRVTIASDSTGVLSVDDNGSTLSIDDGAGSITVDGTVAVSGTVAVTDNASSLTVDAPVATPVFVRLSDGAAAITTLPVSLASVPSHAVTNAGTFAVQVDGALLTSSQLIDDGIATVASAITTKGMAAVGTDGTNARILKTDTGGELQIDVLTIAAGDNNIGNMDVASIAAGDNNIGNVDIVTVPAPLSTTGNGTAATALRVTVASDSTGVVGLATGSNAIGKLTANSGVTIGAVELAAAQTLATVTTLTGGGVAHDSADSGNPVKVGAKASATLSDDTMVANADRIDLTGDLDGALYVRQVPLGDLIYEALSNTDGASTASTNFGATASTRNYITNITAFRTDTATTLAYIDFRDGTGGSVIYRVPLPPASGVTINNGGLPLFYTGANTALAYDVSSALTTVYISLTGFKSKARA